MMDAAEGHGEFIASLAAERARLQVAQVVRVGWLATADQARLLGDRAKVLPVAIAPGCGNGEDALVDADGLVRVGACGPARRLRICIGNCGSIICRGTCSDRSELRQPVFKGVLYKFGIRRRELVLGGKRLPGPTRGQLGRGNVADLRQQPIAQGGRLLAVDDRRGLALRHSTVTPVAGGAGRHPRLIGQLLEHAVGSAPRRRWCGRAKIGRVEIVLAGNADQRKKGVAAGIGQGGAHALRACHLGDRTDRPVRGNPFARGVRKHGGQIDDACGLVDRGGLDRGDLVLPQRLAHDVEAARQGRIAEAAIPLPWPPAADRGGQRFFRVDEFGLGLGQG